MYSITAARYCFNIKAEEELILPKYKGSTFRGGFGQSLKRTVCVSRENRCADCLVKDRCIYIDIFDHTDSLKQDIDNPSSDCIPYIIEPPLEEKESYQKGEYISFHLILFGKSIDYLPYFIYAFMELGETKGIGKNREMKYGRFSIEEVQYIPFYKTPPVTIYHSKDKKIIPHSIKPVRSDDITDKGKKILTINFTTPTKFIYNGKVLPEESLTFNIFMKNLFRRISNLAKFHGGKFLEPDVIKALLKKSEDITVKENRLEFSPWIRYSNRQLRKIKLHGFTGSITFEGELAPFYPYICLGQLTHIGKSTTMGMGMYEVK
ncbi:MAG: CRISPR system precrRNA processing endoribonuclease RAMP protein Cas6 [Nitrospirota bacterium]